MPRRHVCLNRLVIVFIVFALFATSQFCHLANAKWEDKALAKQPNIIFILADDQGWNGTSVQMHPDLPNSKSDFYQTPNLDRLAQAGLRFSQAYAPGPMCSPTRASLQTGKSPAQLRMTNVGRYRPPMPFEKLSLPEHSSALSANEITIGEQLQSAGYATAWFGKWHLGPDGPGAHGYDQHDGPTGNADGNTDDPDNPKDIFGITQRGIAFMEENVKQDQPFYLQLWHYAVHGPVESKPKTVKNMASQPPGAIHDSASFAAMTADLDAGVGMIIDKVEELGIADTTYIVYMSDHGSGLNLSSNSPLKLGKGTLWEGGLRVPLIIRGPGVASGKFCSLPAVGWDLYPTFCHLAGISKELPAGIEGIDLQPWFATGENPDGKRKSIAFHFPHYGQGGRTRSPHSTILVDDFKLIKFYEDDELNLFDLSQDIGEEANLAPQFSDKANELLTQLNQYLASIHAGVPESNPDFDPTANADTGRRGGRGGRPNRSTQIDERKKELDGLEKAADKGDIEQVTQLIQEMKNSIENAPRRPGPANRNGPRRAQRMEELNQLELAAQDKDLKKIKTLIREIRQRLGSAPERPAGRGQRGGRPSENSENDNR